MFYPTVRLLRAYSIHDTLAHTRSTVHPLSLNGGWGGWFDPIDRGHTHNDPKIGKTLAIKATEFKCR